MNGRQHEGERIGGAGAALFAHPGWTRWGAHFAFWLIYFAIRTAAAAADPPDDVRDFPYLANRALAVASYCVLTGILLAVIAGPRANRSNWGRNLALVLGALALAPLTQCSEQMWPRCLAGFAPEPYPFVIYLFQFGWALPLWGLTQALLGYHFETMAQARAVRRAQALAYDAQLRMLHYQINPHFLFNTLNAISTLVLEKRNEQAESMLLRLAGFLRYSLDRQPTELAALSAELEAQRKYLEIEQTRFDDKLKVQLHDRARARERAAAEPHSAAHPGERDQVRDHAARGGRTASTFRAIATTANAAHLRRRRWPRLAGRGSAAPPPRRGPRQCARALGADLRRRARA